MPQVPKRIAVLGAGPAGIEAALLAERHGFDVHVFERDGVAANVGSWGHVRLFSPFGMNVSAWGRAALVEQQGEDSLPADEALLTGHEFAEAYLLPLSESPALSGRIHERTQVIAVGRLSLGKGDAIGNPARAAEPFQLLLQHAERGEETFEADSVLDCTGTFPNHNWCGAGGIPCQGERAAAAEIDYTLPDVLGRDRARFAGRRTLVVGAGYSAATSVVALAQLAEAEPSTSVVWVTRTGEGPPIPRITGDVLVERDRLAAQANALALENRLVQWRPGSAIQRIARVSDKERDGFRVMLGARGTAGSGNRVSEELRVDCIVANVGYRPDLELARELQVHQCYATEGPMKLAAGLLGETSADCLQQRSLGVEALRSPEPGYFVLGSKSYGRNPRFLLRIGHEQIRTVIDELAATTSNDERRNEQCDPGS